MPPPQAPRRTLHFVFVARAPGLGGSGSTSSPKRESCPGASRFAGGGGAASGKLWRGRRASKSSCPCAVASLALSLVIAAILLAAGCGARTGLWVPPECTPCDPFDPGCVDTCLSAGYSEPCDPSFLVCVETDEGP